MFSAVVLLSVIGGTLAQYYPAPRQYYYPQQQQQQQQPHEFHAMLQRALDGHDYSSCCIHVCPELPPPPPPYYPEQPHSPYPGGKGMMGMMTNSDKMVSLRLSTATVRSLLFHGVS